MGAGLWPARAATVLVVLVLHGALLALPGRPRRATELPAEPAPVQVMLLSEAAARGRAPVATATDRKPPAAWATAREPAVVPPAAPAPAQTPPTGPAPLPPDRVALPVTAPDLAPLLKQHVPLGAVRLRLFIAADGRVESVEVLESTPDDAGFAQRLAELLARTPHIPARRGGQNVASIKEVRLAWGAPG
jgi:outer membrane biosynthesis protein TonB